MSVSTARQIEAIRALLAVIEGSRPKPRAAELEMLKPYVVEAIDALAEHKDKSERDVQRLAWLDRNETAIRQLMSERAAQANEATN